MHIKTGVRNCSNEGNIVEDLKLVLWHASVKLECKPHGWIKIEYFGDKRSLWQRLLFNHDASHNFRKLCGKGCKTEKLELLENRNIKGSVWHLKKRFLCWNKRKYFMFLYFKVITCCDTWHCCTPLLQCYVLTHCKKPHA